jgi:hypothetical protein
MKFTLEIELGNEDMRLSWHVADALRSVADCIEDRGDSFAEGGKIHDINGNRVGQWEVVETPEPTVNRYSNKRERMGL